MIKTPYLPLGQSSVYPSEYDPDQLFPVSRQVKRAEIEIQGNLPFMGVDIWNAYELSWLNLRGKPQIALATFLFPADSPNLIESKSFKLYLNSFNQTRLDTKDLTERLTRDLSQAAGASVSVHLVHQAAFEAQTFGELSGYCIDNLDIETDCYTLHSSLLRCEPDAVPIEEVLTSHLLKSNCPVTGQPDWASVQIHYLGHAINRESLLRYLVSFRNHNEFHEQCVERIFMDILHRCDPIKLAVYARYTRRGGLDINPWRTNFNSHLPPNLRNARQ